MLKPYLRISLFWKILLLFWVIFIVVFSFNFLVSYLNSDKVRYRKVPHHLHHQLERTKTKLKFILKENKRRSNRKNKFLKNIFLIGEDGKDYFSKNPSNMLMLLHKEVEKNNSVMTAFRKKIIYFGGLNVSIKNTTYKLYITQHFSVLSRGYFSIFTREFAHSLFISTFLVSFPLSFLLAWLFTRPIKKLQLAVKEMSNNLNERNNLTELINRKDEFGDLAKDFDRMADHLSDIMQSKTQLLSDVSHELKSPLARLQIALGLAGKQQEEHSNSAPIALDRIKLEADRMNQLISHLLEYSKLSTPDDQKNMETFDLAKLIDILVNDAKFESQKKDITISANVQENLVITAVKSMLLSCIENVLRNAIRYANKSITISCHKDHSTKKIVMAICDDGSGVEESKLDKIFDAFYRPETDRSRQSGGVGLGLSIAKKVIDAHNGIIVAENVHPHGLRIKFMLPEKALSPAPLGRE